MRSVCLASLWALGKQSPCSSVRVAVCAQVYVSQMLWILLHKCAQAAALLSWFQTVSAASHGVMDIRAKAEPSLPLSCKPEELPAHLLPGTSAR